MKNISTGRDVQRTAFVENLYSTLKKKTASFIEEHNKMARIAKSYMNDGLEDSECAELLMIDCNLSREAAESYVNMAKNSSVEEDGLQEYSFQFEDAYGKVWSSYEIGKTIKAASKEEAWDKAEEVIMSETSMEPEKIINVDRIS